MQDPKNRARRIFPLDLPLQRHKRHSSLSTITEQQITRPKILTSRANSIHHLQRSSKPIVVNSHSTYVEQESSRSIEHGLFTFRERPLQIRRDNLTARDTYVNQIDANKKEKQKVEMSEVSSFFKQNQQGQPQLSARNPKIATNLSHKSTMRPEELRRMIKALRLGEKPRTMLRI